MALIVGTKQAKSDKKSGPVETGLTGPAATALHSVYACFGLSFYVWALHWLSWSTLDIIWNTCSAGQKNRFILYVHAWYKAKCLNEKVCMLEWQTSVFSLLIFMLNVTTVIILVYLLYMFFVSHFFKLKESLGYYACDRAGEWWTSLKEKVEVNTRINKVCHTWRSVCIACGSPM